MSVFCVISNYNYVPEDFSDKFTKEYIFELNLKQANNVFDKINKILNKGKLNCYDIKRLIKLERTYLSILLNCYLIQMSKKQVYKYYSIVLNIVNLSNVYLNLYLNKKASKINNKNIQDLTSSYLYNIYNDIKAITGDVVDLKNHLYLHEILKDIEEISKLVNIGSINNLKEIHKIINKIYENLMGHFSFIVVGKAFNGDIVNNLLYLKDKKEFFSI